MKLSTRKIRDRITSDIEYAIDDILESLICQGVDTDKYNFREHIHNAIDGCISQMLWNIQNNYGKQYEKEK